MPLPTSWGELYGRMGRLLSVDDVEVELWFREALSASYGVSSLRDLDRRTRGLVFQKASGVLLRLEDEPGDLAFVADVRSIIAAAFARYFDGVALHGPPWRISPTDIGMPSRAEYLGDTGFD